MYKTIFSLLLTLGSFHFLIAQDASNDVLMTIGDKPVTKAEFVRIYTKNNQNPAFDKASLDEYMELFINFKLKVMEAESLKMDTLPAFINELKGYERQLEKPYFTDESADSLLMQEAYERMKWNVHASHILIKCDENALPADTLKAYKKAEKIRQRALNGEDFGSLAVQNSDDPSAARNQGDLGYFTAFSMVYPFESGAYNTKVGDISPLVRTRFGYHIIKVQDKKPDKGQVKVAHLMRAVPQGSSAQKEQMEKEKIMNIYDSIRNGANFEQMVALYSDDRGTSKKGGELPYFGSGRMIPEFEEAAFALENPGDISEPIRTNYGWHIIKLLNKKQLGSFDEVKSTIKSKMSKDIRAERGRQMVMNRLKKEYNLIINKNALKPFYTLIDSTIYMGQWDASKAKGLNNVLITLADSIKYTQTDFANAINKDGKRRANKPLQLIVDNEFNHFVENKLQELEVSQLPVKYPEFKNLLQEYHDGILLFNLTDQMVWSKAVKDTAGLDNFYQANKNNYMWGDRVEAYILTYNNANFEKALVKMIKKAAKKGLKPSDIRAQFLKKSYDKDSTFALFVDKKKYSKGENEWVDALTWEKGNIKVSKTDDTYKMVYIINQVAPEPKKLNEAKGLITADYQNYLEKAWLKELRAKYAIKMNEEVFNSMIK